MPFKGAFQSTWLGYTIRLVSGTKLLPYPDELHVPERYTREGIEKRKARREAQIRRAAAHISEGVEEDHEHVHRAINETGWEEALGEKVRVKVKTHKHNREEHAHVDLNTGEEHVVRPGEQGRQRSSQGAAQHEGSGASGRAEGQTAGDMSEAERGDAGTGDAARPSLSPTDSEETVVDVPVRSGAPYGARANIEKALKAVERAEHGEPNPNLVSWLGSDDPENPYNWSTWYKCFVAIQMAILTFAVYIGSSIYSAGIEGVPNSITEHFEGVSQVGGLVGLTLFVIGYGVGPIFWQPLTDFPQIGRLPIYLGTLFVYVGLNFVLVYAPNFSTILAMRFLTGFVGSPALATGGATMGDMFAPKYLSIGLGVWGAGAICGPVMGPLLGGYAAYFGGEDAYPFQGWQWPIWVLIFMSGGVLVLLAIFFPETSGPTILHRRMKRLRKATGNKDLVSQAQLDAKDTKPSQLAYDTLVRPIVLFREPILLVFNLYLALIYGILYLWFELFPRIFAGVHGFNPGASGLAFMGVFVGAWGACLAYCLYCKYRLFPLFDANGGVLPCPEIRLSPARIAVFTLPIAMFGTITGAYAYIHWIVPVIMTGFFGVGAFALFQVIFGYFGDTYYAEVGAVLVGNDFARSSFGAAFPLFAGAMINRLGIQGTAALLGGLVTLFVPAPFLFMKYGERLRNASKFAVHGSGWEAAKKGGWKGGL